MPHKEYMRRLEKERVLNPRISGGERPPLVSRQSGEDGLIHDGRVLKAKAGHPVVRALTSPYDSSESVRSIIGGNANTTSSSNHHPLPMPASGALRASTPQTPTCAARGGSSPARHAQHLRGASWGISSKLKCDREVLRSRCNKYKERFQRLGASPGGSVASRSVASQYSENSRLTHPNESNLERAHIGMGTKIAGSVVEGMLGAPRNHGDHERSACGEFGNGHSQAKLEMHSPRKNDQAGGSMPLGQNDVVDLTGESDDEVIVLVEGNRDLSMSQEAKIGGGGSQSDDVQVECPSINTPLGKIGEGCTVEGGHNQSSAAQPNLFDRHDLGVETTENDAREKRQLDQSVPSGGEINDQIESHSQKQQMSEDLCIDSDRPKGKINKLKKGSVSGKRKANGAGKNSPTKNSSTVEKPEKMLSCALAGTLACVVRDGKYFHTIRGYWQYENRPGSKPQRFELCREVQSEALPLTAGGGTFGGSFAYIWAPKGQPPQNVVIKERDVIISFSGQDEAPNLLTVNGTGQNKFGKFALIGTATARSAGDSYNLHFQKQYTELFAHGGLQSDTGDGNAKQSMAGEKRKFSMMDTSSGSEETGDQDGEKRQRSSAELHLATCMPLGESAAASNDDMDLTWNQQAGDALEPEPESYKNYSDVIQAPPLKVGGAEANPVSMLLGSYPGVLKATSQSMGGWQDSGDFQMMVHPLKPTRQVTWNVRNVSPAYSQMTLDFLYSAGIRNAQDFLEADTDDLSSRLMAFGGFKAACALYVWKRKLKHKTEYANKVFSEVYRKETAERNILDWREKCQSWFERNGGEFNLAVSEANEMDAMEVGSDAEKSSARSEEEDIIQVSEGETSDEQVALENILGAHWASILSNHCNISTSRQLLAANNGGQLVEQLTDAVRVDFDGRERNDVRLIAEGLLYGWFIQVQEALKGDGSNTEASSSPFPTGEEEQGVPVDSNGTAEKPCMTTFKTPLGYVDLQFIRSQKIATDQELAEADSSRLASRYIVYLAKTSHLQLSPEEAHEAASRWRQGARSVLGISSGNDICDTLPYSTRLDKDSGQLSTMHTIPNLCKTTPDQDNGGLPKRIIFTHDTMNDILYEFEVTVNKSTCSDDAGHGAFITFKGARVLKTSSKWKKKRQINVRQTRKQLEALFSISGATVTLSGTNLHGDEHHYNSEKDCSVGVYNEFTLDDFEDAEDNITFSSKHIGCGLIELESRYAPVLPVDRKTDFIFSIKDFLFSYEPSSWRFDVEEKLNGRNQVVDFTDDATGAPHVAARSNMSMYVNEVGHNMDLVENVQALNQTPRSVTYFIHIDNPMLKGDQRELLVNYKEAYEEMRERKGYGQANLLHGVKSDSHDITRVVRNLSDRRLTENSVLKWTEDEISQLVHFLKERVWPGLRAAASTLHSCQGNDNNLARQCVALRRLDWLTKILRTRFHNIIGARGVNSLYSTDSDACIFQPGMHVYVHNWPPAGERSAYTGIATITSINKDRFNRAVFEVHTADRTYIESVPEAAVTVPTDDDFEDAPQRQWQSWLKSKKQQELPRKRLQVLNEMDAFQWDPSFLREVGTGPSHASSFEMQAKVVSTLRWELVEEMAFLLTKHKRTPSPFDEKSWCPLSVGLMTKCLHLIADFLLMGKEPKISLEMLMRFARDTAQTMRETTNFDDLAFDKEGNAPRGDRFLVVEDICVDTVSVDDQRNNPVPLDSDWYIIHQIVMVVHPLASLIDWGVDSDGKPLYRVEKLLQAIGLDTDAPYVSLGVPDWQPLMSRSM